MKPACSAVARSAGSPGGAISGSAMKNGASAKSSSRSAFGSLVSSRPVGTSGNSPKRVVRPNMISGRNAPACHSAGWPTLIEASPTTWPSSSLRCCARNTSAAPR